MGLRALNNPNSSFEDRFAGTGISGTPGYVYSNPGEWTRILNAPGTPAGAGSNRTGTLDVTIYNALLIFAVTGGGGGGANGNDNGAGGGGGGSYVNGYVVSVEDVPEISYQIPGGGTGGTGDANGPPTGWPARQSGVAAATLGVGTPTDVTSLYGQVGGGAGTGGYVEGGGGNSGGSGAGTGPVSAPTATAGGAGGRNISCDNPPDGGNPGSAVAASNGAAGGGGGGGTWCGPTPGRTGLTGGNSTISQGSLSSWTLPGSFPAGPAPFPMPDAYSATWCEWC
jgi:hypothetical protein